MCLILGQSGLTILGARGAPFVPGEVGWHPPYGSPGGGAGPAARGVRDRLRFGEDCGGGEQRRRVRIRRTVQEGSRGGMVRRMRTLRAVVAFIRGVA